jgi:transcriptional regulator with XRE-family HTH domain
MIKARNCSYCKGSGKELDPVSVGAEMRKLRLASGVIQQDVGKRMGLSKQHICALEKGNRNWTADLISRYKKALQ